MKRRDPVDVVILIALAIVLVFLANKLCETIPVR